VRIKRGHFGQRGFGQGRMGVNYDPEAGYFEIATTVTNTVVPNVLAQVEFWLFFSLHLLVFMSYQFGYLKVDEEGQEWLRLNWNDLKVVSGATTFFEVFYTSQCFSRYLHLHHTSRLMIGNLYDFSFELRLYFRELSQKHVRLAARLLTASLILFFYETNQEVDDRGWQELLRQGLVTPAEQNFLQHYTKHYRSLILLQWSGEVIKDIWKTAKLPANVLNGLIQRLLRARILEQQVVDTCELPMPFQYFHLLNMMVVVNLLLWAYGMGTTNSVFAPVIFFFASLIFMGMLELASALSDPFGDDDVDFPVADWLTEFLETTIALIEHNCPLSVEERLEMETPLPTRRRSRFLAPVHKSLRVGQLRAAKTSAALETSSGRRDARHKSWQFHGGADLDRDDNEEDDDDDDDD